MGCEVSVGMFVLALVAILLIIIAGNTVAVWRAEKNTERQVAQSERSTNQQMGELQARMEKLNLWVEDLERTSDAQCSPPQRTFVETRTVSNESMAVKAVLPAQTGAFVPPSNQLIQTTHPVDIALDELAIEAAHALVSSTTFKSFVERYRDGVGYSLEPGGAAPIVCNDSPDRADLWVFQHLEWRTVFPGFNLRRSEGLLVSDVGRAAEGKLGWLYEIEQGDVLRALKPAVVALDSWEVRRKGRLSLPL